MAKSFAMRFFHDSAPNPGKLIESLRHLGYDNYHAIADLVDNCIDADAETIKILVRTREGETEIIIADSGIGMDRSVLDQAIRLGSLVEKDTTSDLGKFGMGLCTASLSLCRETTVLTKAQDEYLLKAVNDVDEVKRQGAFVSFFGDPAAEDQELFHDLLTDSPNGTAAHGTVVVLQKCDNLQNRNTTTFANKLKKDLSRIFRYFLAGGRKIFVNGDQLSPFDPLMWDNPKTEKFDDNNLKLTIDDDGTLVTDHVRIKLAILPDAPAVGEGEEKLGIKNQGFYVLRNNREILDAVSLDFFLKHNSLNRFRGEIHFGGKLDKYMNVNFTKRNVALWQSVQDQLQRYLVGQIQTIRKRLTREQRAEATADVREVHEDVSEQIRKKSKLLLIPKAPKEKRKPNNNNQVDDSPKKAASTNRIRQPGESKQPGGIAADCCFETASMTESGPIWDVEQQGRTVIVKWNCDHVFYKRFILDNAEKDRAMAAASDFLVYSFACAELLFFANNDDAIGLITNLKMAVSGNMRTLLS